MLSTKYEYLKNRAEPGKGRNPTGLGRGDQAEPQTGSVANQTSLCILRVSVSLWLPISSHKLTTETQSHGGSTEKYFELRRYQPKE